MMHNRYIPGQSSSIRKSRLDNKPSMLPVPRRPGSTDRTSTDAKRPSTTGVRSSSAEPARGTFAGGRLSREASSTKLSTNGRSRSQTGHATSTPLRGNHYSRPTITPLRTPDDRNSRSWETCLERALAFVTIKDQRPISTAAWQRSEYARVAAALGAHGCSGAALVRPLTITRFVELVAELMAAVIGNPKLTTDNYMTRLPHVCKKLLYPSAVSKSWLRTVNTLHAFPHALALIAYLLDLAVHCQLPVSDEGLYGAKDELSRLRQDYIRKCWIRFQLPDSQFDDLTEEYFKTLKVLLGNDDEKILELELEIKNYESVLEDSEELAAVADEARRVERREALSVALRGERATRRALAAELETQRAAVLDQGEALRLLDAEIERAGAGIEQLRAELEQQTMSVEERVRLLDEVDYATRVSDSKKALAEQISKMLLSKETELAQWQKRTLDSCVEYKHGLIHLSAQLPALAALAIDEKELMGAECAAYMAAAVETLRAEGAALANRKAELMRSRSALGRQRALLLDETRSKIAEAKSSVQREQQTLDADLAKESSEAAAWSKEQAEIKHRLEQLRLNQEDYAKVHAELEFWKKQDLAWRTKLSEVHQYIEQQRLHARRTVVAATRRREALVRDALRLWYGKLDGERTDNSGTGH